jgi:hypothetical protein
MGGKLDTLALLAIDGIVILEVIVVGVAIVLVILLFYDSEVIVTIKLEVIVLGLRDISPCIYKEA